MLIRGLGHDGATDALWCRRRDLAALEGLVHHAPRPQRHPLAGFAACRLDAAMIDA